MFLDGCSKTFPSANDDLYIFVDVIVLIHIVEVILYFNYDITCSYFSLC